jgi:hypothetical protein
VEAVDLARDEVIEGGGGGGGHSMLWYQYVTVLCMKEGWGGDSAFTHYCVILFGVVCT